jgi:DNA polymerase II large subunit
LTNGKDFFKPRLPLHIEPHSGFVNEYKPIKNRGTYNLPLWLFRDKTNTHKITSQKQKKLVNKIFYNNNKSTRLSLEQLQDIPKLVENSNLHTINKEDTFQEQE